MFIRNHSKSRARVILKRNRHRREKAYTEETSSDNVNVEHFSRACYPHSSKLMCAPVAVHFDLCLDLVNQLDLIVLPGDFKSVLGGR